MEKHAYCIIAHKDDYTFQTLLNLLDDKRNDIFVHMDIKNKEFDNTKYQLKNSRLFFVERTNVTWGGYSQINSELILLKTALEIDCYSYYHLLSGEDLPIKTQDYIHNFFEENNGKQFVRFENTQCDYLARVCYRYPLQEMIGRKKKPIISFLSKVILKFQIVFRIKRNVDITFQKGTNWFSITSELAKYVIEKEAWIKKVFAETFCADEIFLQTIVVNSDFVNSLYNQKFNNELSSIMRLIDWERGTPYVYTNSDFQELIESDMLWARKFDCTKDKEIIDNIVAYLNKA